MVFLWSLSSNKSTQLARTFLSIMTILCDLDGVGSSSDFQLYHSLFQAFVDRSKHQLL